MSVAIAWRANRAIKKCLCRRAVIAGHRPYTAQAAQLVGCRWHGNGPRFAAVGPSGAGFVAVGLCRCPPACAGNVGKVRSVADGRRASGRGNQMLSRAYAARKLPACVPSTSRPTRPLSLTACGVEIRAILAVLGAASAAYGQPVGRHPSIVYRTNCLFASVGGACVAGDGCHQKMLYCRASMAGLHLIRTRAAQLVYGSVVGTWPAFRSGWPVRRGFVAVGSRRCRPRGVGNVGEVVLVADGRRAQRGGLPSVGSCVLARKRPACVHSNSRPTRPYTRPAESGRFW
jgi:hypothetical protein